jgi:tetratricopeptide (TPR) repeat protein
MPKRALLVLGMVWLAAAPAAAQPEDGAGDEDPQGPSAMREEHMTDEEARSRFRVGQALYREGRFLDAAREFDAAYALSPRPVLLFNAYLAYRDAGDLAHAVPSLRLYLEQAPDAQDAALLQQRLDSLQARLDEQSATDQAGEAERQRLEQERLAAEADAERAREEAEAAERARQEAEEPANPLGWIVGGTGAAMLVGGTIAGIIAKGRIDDLEERCPNDLCPTAFDLEGERDSAQRAARATDALLFGGGAVLITGIVLIAMLGGDADEEDEETAPPATAAFGCTGDGCAMSVTVGF